MKTDVCYSYLNKARGLNTPEDVRLLAAQQGRVYDAVVQDWLPSDRGVAIYEAGCGTGVFMLWLKDRGYTNARGTDSSSESISLAASLGLKATRADSLADMEGMSPSSLDVIVAIDFVEHLTKEQCLDFIHSAFRALKPDGCLIARMPNGDSPLVGRNLFNCVTHQWAYTTVAMRVLLEMVGFSTVRFKDEAMASIEGRRWMRVPLMMLSRWFVQMVIKQSTREVVEYLSPSIFVVAWKRC